MRILVVFRAGRLRTKRSQVRVLPGAPSTTAAQRGKRRGNIPSPSLCLTFGGNPSIVASVRAREGIVDHLGDPHRPLIAMMRLRRHPTHEYRATRAASATPPCPPSAYRRPPGGTPCAYPALVQASGELACAVTRSVDRCRTYTAERRFESKSGPIRARLPNSSVYFRPERTNESITRRCNRR